jgi:hypothetical protein
VYQAVAALTAKEGWTFDGVAANSFTYAGATTVSNAADSGTVAITFPATGAEGGPAAVSAFSLDGAVTAPVKGATPNTTAIDGDQYTGTIVWQTSAGAAHSGSFAASTVYQAVAALTAKEGWTFDGVAANSFTYAGATTVSNAANSGIAAIVFPATGAGGGPAAVSAFSLDGAVTAPVKGATPSAAAIDGDQYTGTVVWQTSAGAAHSGSFAASTVYQAVAALTAKEGWTFDGVVANSFTHAGATTASNAADSGTVAIAFPATEAPDPNAAIPIGSPSVKLYFDGGATALAHNGTTNLGSAGAGTCTVSIDSESYSSIIWYLNGTPQSQASGNTSIVLSKRTAGAYLITVEATANGGVKQSGAHTFVVE